MSKLPTGRRLFAAMAGIVLLLSCLCITTYALVMLSVSIDDNTFTTGTVKINLNDGNPVIREDEYLFEPGMTVSKTFFVENESTGSVYYKLYFTDVRGDLGDILQVTIRDGDQLLLSGTPNSLSRSAAPMAEELAVGQRRDLTVTFHYPESAGNQTQQKTLSFRLTAEAVQTKNNPQQEFD